MRVQGRVLPLELLPLPPGRRPPLHLLPVEALHDAHLLLVTWQSNRKCVKLARELNRSCKGFEMRPSALNGHELLYLKMGKDKELFLIVGG